MKTIELQILHQLGFKNPGFPLYFEGTTAFTINENYSFNCAREDLTFGDLLHVVLNTIVPGDSDSVNIAISGYLLTVDKNGNADVYSEQAEINQDAFHGTIEEAINWIESELKKQSELDDIDDLPFPEDNDPITCPLEKLIAEWAVWCHRNKITLLDIDEMAYLLKNTNTQQHEKMHDFKKRLEIIKASL